MGKELTERLERPGAPTLAFRRTRGAGPDIVFLPGFGSDLSGDKASALHAWAEQAGRAFIRFDYSGHGESAGAFEEGCLTSWLTDTLAVIDSLTEGRVVLVGASMGGWLALLAAKARAERVNALVLVAPAPDFTESLWGELSFAERRALADAGRIVRASPYAGEPNVYTRTLIEDGRKHLLLSDEIGFAGPVRILHGQKDDAVHWRLSLMLAERLSSEDVHLTLIKDGDHRLSRPHDLNLLIDLVDEVA